MDNLTPQLSVDQIKQNIDALKKQGKDSRSIQAYVDNYKRDTSGNFILKSEQPEQKSLTESSTGSIPVVKQLTDIGTGIGTGIAKAGLGLGQTFMKGANVISNLGVKAGLSDAPIDQYNPVISGIEKIKNDVYTKPFENQLNTIGGKTGEITADVATFVAPGSAIAKAQEVATGAYKATEIAQKLVSSGVPGKIADYIAKKGIQGLTDALGTAGVTFGTTGGDTEKAGLAGLGAGVLGSLTHIGSDIVKAVVPQTVKENVARVFGFTGRKGLAEASGGGIDNAVGAMQTMSKLAPDIKITDINGVEKAFVPKDTNFIELPQALSKSKELIYKAYSDLAKQAGEKGAEFTAKDFYSVIDDLNKYSGKGYTPAFTSKAEQIKEAIRRFVKTGENGQQFFGDATPDEIQSLIQNINKDVNPLSDRAGSEVAQTASQKIRQILTDKITSATGNPEYQKLRTAYSQLSSIENNVINKWKIAMRKSGIQPGLIDGIATVDGLMGIVTMNPAQMARSGFTELVNKTFKYLKDPENNLRRAFDIIDNGQDTGIVGKVTGKGRFTQSE